MSVNEIVTNVVINASTTGVTKSSKQLDALAATCQRIPEFIRMQVATGKSASQISSIDKAILGLGNQTAAVNGKVADMRTMFANVAETAGNAKLAETFRGPTKEIAKLAAGVRLADGAWEHYRETLSTLGITKISKQAQDAAKLMLGSVAPVGGANATYVKRVAANTGGTEQVGSVVSQTSSASKEYNAQTAKDMAAAANAAAAEENRLAQAESASASAAANAAGQQKNLADASSKAANAANNLSKTLNKQNGITAATAGAFFRLRAIVASVAMVMVLLGQSLKSWFDMASEYAETNHLLYATLANDLGVAVDAEEALANGTGRALRAVDLFGNTIESATVSTDEFGNKIYSGTVLTNESAAAIENIVSQLNDLSDRLQVDPTNLKKTYATFYEMANSAGMAADKVHEVAKGMTQLTYDIGSLWDEDFESVAKKMRSALGGITTSVRLFGIDISRSAADTYLMEHGIDATYNSLDRASKMLTIYNMLLKGTTTDQDDLARSAAQPANLLRILGEQAQYAGRMLGAAIFPVITPLIALFYNLMKAIQAAAQALSSFLSFVFGSWYTAASDGWNSFLGNLKMGGAAAEEVEEGMDGIAGGAGGAADAAKELKKQLMGFDEINNITPEVDTGGGGGGGGGGGAMPTGGVDIWEQISAALDDVRSKIMDFANNAVPNTLKVLASFASGVAEGFLQGFSVIPGIILTIVGALDHLIGALRLMFGTYEENGETRYYFDDMVEGIGKFIGTLAGLSVGIGLFSKLGSLISGLFSSTGLLFKVFSPLINLLKMPIASGLLTTVLQLAGGSNSLMAVLKGLLTVFTSLMSPVGIVVAVITALAAAFLYCYNNSAEFREFLSGLVERLSAFGDMIASMVQPAFEALQGAFANLASAIGLVGSPIDYLVPILEFLISVITTLLQVVIQFIAGVVTGVTYVVEFIVNMVAGFIEIVVGGITSFFAFLGEIFGIGNETVTTDSENMKASVIGAFDGMSLESIPIIGGFLANVFEFFSNAGTNIGTAMDTIGSLVSGGWTYVTTLVGSAFGVLRDTFSTVVDVMAQPFKDAWDKIKEIFGWLKGLLSGSLSFPHINVPHFKVDGGQLPWGIGGSGYPPSIRVLWYAKGGIATKASLAGIGEAGDEGIIPLQGARMKPFALAISDNINKFGAENVSQSDKEMLNASLAQSALLREQNNLLRQILAKDNNVSIDGREIINSINRQQRVQGRQLIGAY